MLQEPQFTPKSKVFIASDDAGTRGVAYYGRQLAIAADNEALPSFAVRARQIRGERMIIGPRATVSIFGSSLRNGTRRRASFASDSSS